MPFGLKNAPACFQRVMKTILRKHQLNHVTNYFDDNIIFSNDFTDHLKHLSSVLTALQKENIKLKISKCSFAKQEISFLGYQIKDNKISPHQDNISAIERYSTPKNIKELQRFLGMVNVYSRFIPQYAKLRHSLNQLLKKDTLWNWSTECESSFHKLKECLTSSLVL